MHSRSQQFFYVLCGTATFLIDNDIQIISAGESVHIPAGKKHLVSNNENEALEFLVVSQPIAHGDRVDI
jgi:quercetin dioxygenase-like cupin family protein